MSNSEVRTMSFVIDAASDEQADARAEQINRILLKGAFAGWHVVRLDRASFMVTFYQDAAEGMTAHADAVDDYAAINKENDCE